MKARNRIAIALAIALAPGAALAQDFDNGQAAWTAGDYAVALREWQPLAKQGHAEAQRALGYMYEHGIGVEEDETKAVTLYRRAALQGSVEAQFRLGLMTAEGTGTPQDYYAAHIWLNIAGANGYAKAHALRDLLSKKMHPSDVIEAQRRANECFDSHYAKCDWGEDDEAPTS